jgi:hypothetical protein
MPSVPFKTSDTQYSIPSIAGRKRKRDWDLDLDRGARRYGNAVPLDVIYEEEEGEECDDICVCDGEGMGAGTREEYERMRVMTVVFGLKGSVDGKEKEKGKGVALAPGWVIYIYFSGLAFLYTRFTRFKYDPTVLKSILFPVHVGRGNGRGRKRRKVEMETEAGAGDDGDDEEDEGGAGKKAGPGG